MHNDFALDLHVARRNAGLRQKDSAHLLAIDQSRLSRFEKGKALPNIREFCALALIYGCSFENLLASLVHELHRLLPERLATLPACLENTADTFNRQQTINRLVETLDVLLPENAA